jgi:hypothetical protein
MNRVCLVVLALTVAVGAEESKPKMIRFNKDSLDKVPTGWTATKTGKGEGSVWKVVADDTTPSKSGYALAQTAEGPGPLFNLCVHDSTLKDVELTVSFKSVKGENDQGGGIVWRYVDANNYYVARYNPLEDNFRLYKVVAGKRTQLASKEGLKSAAGKWHSMKVRHVGDAIECSLDGTKHLEAKDDTFARSGKVGLWTKADARTHFDDFPVKSSE